MWKQLFWREPGDPIPVNAVWLGVLGFVVFGVFVGLSSQHSGWTKPILIPGMFIATAPLHAFFVLVLDAPEIARAVTWTCALLAAAAGFSEILRHTDLRDPDHLLTSIVFGGCSFVDRAVESNGETGVLMLQRSIGFPHLCGADPVPNPCAGSRPCWIRHLSTGSHDLVVARQISVRSGNGLGDASRCIEYEVAGNRDLVTVSVRPPEVATATVIESCERGLRLSLTIHLVAEFELAVTVGRRADRWLLQSVDACETYVCEETARPGVGSCAQ